MVTATMRISGHFNPAVTIGFLATRRIEPMMAGVYIVAQILGAIARGVRAQGDSSRRARSRRRAAAASRSRST